MQNRKVFNFYEYMAIHFGINKVEIVLPYTNFTLVIYIFKHLYFRCVNEKFKDSTHYKRLAIGLELFENYTQ